MTLDVLVTGGAGYIGSQTCKALARAGFHPVVYDDLSNGHPWAVGWGPLVHGDLRDETLLTDTLRRYNPVAVIHFAGLIEAGLSVREPLRFHDVNVMGSLSLLRAMKTANTQAANIGLLVFSSSAAVYGTLQWTPVAETHPTVPTSPYGRSKLIVEQILADIDAAHGLRYVALRYFNAAGADPDGDLGEAHEPETHLIPLALEAADGRRVFEIYGTDYDTPDGTCIRDFVHVSDLAEAHVLALRHLLEGGRSEAINIGSGIGASVKEVVDACRIVTGREIPLLVKERRLGDPPVLVADCLKAANVLGWVPRRSDLTTIISDAWRWDAWRWDAWRWDAWRWRGVGPKAT